MTRSFRAPANFSTRQLAGLTTAQPSAATLRDPDLGLAAVPVWLSRYRRIWRFHIAAGCALAVIGATAMATAAAQPAGGGSAKDPLRLFQPMMTVFSHPRCSNCHGAVDVLAGINHDQLEKSDVPFNEDGDMLPGQDGNDKCRECHDEDEQNSVWRLAPRSRCSPGKTSNHCAQNCARSMASRTPLDGRTFYNT